MALLRPKLIVYILYFVCFICKVGTGSSVSFVRYNRNEAKRNCASAPMVSSSWCRLRNEQTKREKSKERAADDDFGEARRVVCSNVCLHFRVSSAPSFGHLLFIAVPWRAFRFLSLSFFYSFRFIYILFFLKVRALNLLTLAWPHFALRTTRRSPCTGGRCQLLDPEAVCLFYALVRSRGGLREISQSAYVLEC